MALSRHLPIITNRMEFKRKKLLPSPSITQRIEFTGLSFGGSDSMLGAVETVTTSSIESSPGPEQEDSQSEDDDEGDDERGSGSRSIVLPQPVDAMRIVGWTAKVCTYVTNSQVELVEVLSSIEGYALRRFHE